MTEAEWLACTNPYKMLDFLGQRASQRKLRLFACACCRRIWHLLPDERSRWAVEFGERLADGEESAEAQLAALRETRHALRAARQKPFSWAMRAALHLVTRAKTAEAPAEAALAVEQAMAWEVNADREPAGILCFESVLSLSGPRGRIFEAWENERTSQCELVRDIFGNPFSPPAPIAPSLLTPRVLTLVLASYNERNLPAGTLDHARLAALAAALEEAGCKDAGLLAHLRSEAPHVRGCWVTDLLLGKE